METKQFQKRVEDFVCERCGNKVAGSGYTNHCSKCLWSKHVDEHPGDRQSPCHGMMEPISVSKKGDEYIIHYKCRTCGKIITNKSAPDDNFDALIELSKKAA